MFGMAGTAELKFMVEDLPKLMQNLTKEKWDKIDEHFKVGFEIKIP